MNTKQLRQKILDLAIRGELVPQDPSDEPASVLLERIRAEKEQLIKDKKLKRDKKDNEPIDEVPFELPEGWVWCRLKEIITELKYGTSEKSSLEGKIPVLRMGNITTNGTIDYSNIVFSSNEEDIKEFLLTKGNLVFNRTNSSDLVGKTAIYRGEMPAIFAGYLIKIALLKVNPEYTNFVMNSSYYRKWCYSVKSDAVNQSNINAEKLSNLLIPLPPLAVQHRIVQIAEQLLAIVDAIKLLQEQLKSDVKQAKNQVLSDAIAGKLTHQDPNDEPAEALLKRIGKTTTTAADTPYEKLPKGWAWCRLGDIGTINPKNKLNDELDVSFIPMPLISDAFSNVHTSEVKKWGNIKKGYTHFCNEDIGIAKITPCFENRKSVIFNNLKNGVGAGTTELYILRNNKTLSFNKYIFWFIKTQEFINNGIKAFTGAVGQQRISRDFIENTLIPLPPIAEQHRIVEKIESYFSFLDTIEIQINS